jgi:hypothetical protein
MRCTALLSPLVLCAGLLAAEPAKPAKEEGFTPLFDGKSFAGWKVKATTPKSWKVENGLLVLTGGGSHLFTEKEYEDFVVRFEWRPAKKGYNSGFYIRGGNQIQMAQGDAGRLFGAKAAKGVPKLHKAPGEWNEWEVSCIGPKVSLRVNGELAWEVDDFKPKRGPLGIEAEGAHIDFRNLRIREIKKTEK